MTVLRDMRLWLGGAALAPQSSSVRLSTSVEEKDRTGLNATARHRRGGLRDSAIGASGYFDAGAVDASLLSNVGLTGVPVGVTAPDAQEGVTRAFALRPMVGEYQPLAGAVGDLAEFQLSASGDGVLARGRLALDRDIEASGTGPVFQMPSVMSGRRMFAALFVTAITPGASLEVLARTSGAEARSAAR